MYLMTDNSWDTLLRKISQEHCTPFLGAGISWSLLQFKSEVARKLAKKFNYPLPDKDNLPRVAQFISTETDPLYLKLTVQSFLKDGISKNITKYNELYKILAQLPFPIYITTNYDDFMFHALLNAGKQPKYEYCRWNRLIRSMENNITDDFEPTINVPLIYHLQGIWDVPQSLVLTEDDSIDFLVNVSKDIGTNLHHRIIRALAGTTLLFIGYDLEEISFRTLFKSIITSVGDGFRQINIAIQIPPEEKYRQEIKQELTTLLEINNELEIEPRILFEIASVINDLSSIINKEIIDKEYKKKFIKNTIILEEFITEQKIENLIKNFIISIINKLQEQISSITNDDKEINFEILRYLEKYYSTYLNINIYWTDATEFAKELFARWQNFPKK